MAKWNKKGLTPEEKEKRKELLRKQVENVINNFENSPENIVEYLKFNSRFHQYSANNTLLIYEQNNMARFCASYKAFQDMGYQVQKGQTGMKIFVPYITTVFHDTESDQWIKLSEGTKEQKELVKSGQLESKQFTSFGIGTVFDIGQTDCPPEEYPKLCDMGFASETHQRLYDALVYYAESQNISVEEKFFPSITTRGYYDRGDNSIALSDKLNDSMKLSVMSHELAHAVMHSSEEAAQIPRLQIEIEADSLSLMLRQHLGITEIEDVRQDHLKSAYKNYIELAKSDAGDNEYPDLSKILDNVNKAYLSIIDDFNNTVTNYLEQHKVTVQKLTLDEYLGLQGLSSPVDDFMIDKLKIPHGLTQRQENKLNKQASDASKEYHTRRNTAIKEYYERVERGEIVEPSPLERTMKAAAGHSDNKSTQAAIRMLEKRGYVKDGQGNWIKSSQPTKDFSKSIDDLLNEKLNPRYQIYVCKTTEVMKACGVKDLDVVINQSSIKKILSDDKEKFPHAHNLSVQELKELPIQLQKPIMAFKGSHENSIVFVTDIKDINDNEILISVDIDTAGYNQNVNRVTSMYGKDNITNYLKTQIDKGNMIGCDKKRANQMLSTRGLQLPPATTFIDYTSIIPNIGENVNQNNLINDTSLLIDTLSKGENVMEDKIYAPENTIYIENQTIFDELTTQPNIRYHFHNHHFSNIKFSDKTIIGHLGGCTLNRCTFENFNGNNIDFSESLFSDCKIINSNFENSVFENAEIRNSQIINSNFNNSIFFLAEIRHSGLDGNNLSAVNFSNAGLIDVHIRNSLINEPVQNLSPEKITMPGATPQEIEIHRSRILDALKIEPFIEAHPSQDEIDFVAKYEETNLVPDSVRVTEWFGDYGMNVTRPNITEQLFARQLALAKEQATSLFAEKNELTKSQQSLPKYELREVAQWSDDRNYLNFSVVIDDYLFDGTFRIADDVNGKGMSIISINCYSSGQENQVSEIWDELTEQLQEKALQIQNEQSESNIHSHPKIIAEFIQESNKSTNVIMQYPNGLYYNHYGYDFDKDISQSNAGGFETVEEAKKMMLKHRSDSVEITEPEIFKSSLNNNENVINTEFEDILNRQLKDTGELPVNVLCDEGKIEWYSFAGAINNTEKVKELLQNIQQKNNQVVSICNTDDNYQLVCMNNDLNIIPYSDNVYPTADEALKAVLENDNIAKLVPYDAMLQASSEQNLLPLSECDNGKYPFVKINWSDNSELAKEGCFPFDKAEELFSSINELCREEDKLERTGISLFLDAQNSYNLEINLGNEVGGITEHLKQLINEGNISNKSLQHLQKYLRENDIVYVQEVQSEHATQMDFFELQ